MTTSVRLMLDGENPNKVSESVDPIAFAGLITSDEEEFNQNDEINNVNTGDNRINDSDFGSSLILKWIIKFNDEDKEGVQVTENERVLRLQAPSGAKKFIEKENLQKNYHLYLEKAAQQDESNILGFDEFCKAVIQNWWQKKKSPGKKKLKKRKKKVENVEEKAAKVIQRAWRRYIDREVFRYYRDLINFRCYGDPAMMLKCVNPKEASLLDAAAGIHIRFRLGGEKFPPSIYYKIFTHRPVQDLCANAPRDYTKQESKKCAAKTANNRVENALPAVNNRSGWYERVENNGWRLVSDRLLNHLYDPVTYRTSNKPVTFHHNKIKRKKDVEASKKKKKVEWMKKLYKEGILKAKTDDQITMNLVENAAEGLVKVYETKGMNAVKDWEVDELLSWTNALNFDDYWNDWKTVGTTAFSEKVLDNFNIQPLERDAYSFSMSSKQRTVTAFNDASSHNKSTPMPYSRELTMS